MSIGWSDRCPMLGEEMMHFCIHTAEDFQTKREETGVCVLQICHHSHSLKVGISLEKEVSRMDVLWCMEIL